MILVLNAGSSSLKAALFDRALAERARWTVAEIGRAARLDGAPVEAPDHEAALRHVLDRLPGRVEAAAHRVVHGGTLRAPVALDEPALAAIEAAAPLAPLHNPSALAGIRAVAALLPGLPQTASLDTAFHATIPQAASTYALPEPHRTRLRRTGFHGLSYASLAARLSPLPRRLLAFHLGNGASACAILEGRSVATTMGATPLGGMVMGTRDGTLEPGATLALARALGVEEAERLLTRESGLLALAGASDMRALLARDDRAALDHFAHWAARAGASLLPSLGGLDALAFTGGIGENAAPLREAIRALLAFAGDVPVHVVPAEEERRIAADALALLGAPG